MGSRMSKGQTQSAQKKASRADMMRPDDSLIRAFARIDRIRRKAKPLPKGIKIKDLIEEGRR